MPSKSILPTLYELWNGVKPNLGYFHPWGCATYIHNTSHEYQKLGRRGKKCIFIRYSKHSKWFVFMSEKAYGRVTKIESRDVVFLEKVFSKDMWGWKRFSIIWNAKSRLWRNKPFSRGIIWNF
jgi:hypothetical protein